jgi:hypothetical protein
MLVTAVSELHSIGEIQKCPAVIGTSEIHIFIHGLSKGTLICLWTIVHWVEQIGKVNAYDHAFIKLETFHLPHCSTYISKIIKQHLEPSWFLSHLIGHGRKKTVKTGRRWSSEIDLWRREVGIVPLFYFYFDLYKGLLLKRICGPYVSSYTLSRLLGYNSTLLR